MFSPDPEPQTLCSWSQQLYMCTSPPVWLTCYPMEAAIDSRACPVPGWLQQHHGGSDGFNVVTALLNDVAGAEIKLKWLKPAAVLAGLKMFQMS